VRNVTGVQTCALPIFLSSILYVSTDGCCRKDTFLSEISDLSFVVIIIFTFLGSLSGKITFTENTSNICIFSTPSIIKQHLDGYRSEERRVVKECMSGW